LPATSHTYVIASPSGSDAEALNENCVSCAMPNAGAKFIELIAGERLVAVGVVGAVGVDGVDDDELPPPQAAAARETTSATGARCFVCTMMTSPPRLGCAAHVQANEGVWTGVVRENLGIVDF
jgi:hypothetical protein